MGWTDSELGSTVHTAIFKMDICSNLCGSLDGRGVWRRMDICICVAESLCCLPETITTCLIGYTPISNKKLKKINMISYTITKYLLQKIVLIRGSWDH